MVLQDLLNSVTGLFSCSAHTVVIHGQVAPLCVSRLEQQLKGLVKLFTSRGRTMFCYCQMLCTDNETGNSFKVYNIISMIVYNRKKKKKTISWLK